MDWREKARIVHETVVKNWPVWSDEDKRFLALALGGEVGELQNLIKKEWRGDTNTGLVNTWHDRLALEMADIRIYLELLAKAYKVDLDQACERKMKEVVGRWPESIHAIRKAEGGA